MFKIFKFLIKMEIFPRLQYVQKKMKFEKFGFSRCYFFKSLKFSDISSFTPMPSFTNKRQRTKYKRDQESVTLNSPPADWLTYE